MRFSLFSTSKARSNIFVCNARRSGKECVSRLTKIVLTDIERKYSVGEQRQSLLFHRDIMQMTLDEDREMAQKKATEWNPRKDLMCRSRFSVRRPLWWIKPKGCEFIINCPSPALTSVTKRRSFLSPSTSSGRPRQRAQKWNTDRNIDWVLGDWPEGERQWTSSKPKNGMPTTRREITLCRSSLSIIERKQSDAFWIWTLLQLISRSSK